MATAINRAKIKANLEVYDQASSNAAVSTTPAQAVVRYDAWDDEFDLSATSTPPATLFGAAVITMTAGAATIDLRALVCTDGITRDFNGLKVRTIKFRASSANANAITVVKGASNGFTGLGASFSLTLPVPTGTTDGQIPFNVFHDGGGGTAVSATVKTLDVSGTGAQVLHVEVIGGA